MSNCPILNFNAIQVNQHVFPCEKADIRRTRSYQIPHTRLSRSARAHFSISVIHLGKSFSKLCYLSASVFAWIAFMLSQIEHILIVNLAFGSPFDRGGHICIEFVDNCLEFGFRRTIIWRCTLRKANLTNCWSVDASNQIHRWAVVRFTAICTFLLLRRTWLHSTRKFL